MKNNLLKISITWDLLLKLRFSSSFHKVADLISTHKNYCTILSFHRQFHKNREVKVVSKL